MRDAMIEILEATKKMQIEASKIISICNGICAKIDALEIKTSELKTLKCRDCGKVLTLEHFSADTQNQEHGKRTQCKLCYAKYFEAYKAKKVFNNLTSEQQRAAINFVKTVNAEINKND